MRSFRAIENKLLLDICEVFLDKQPHEGRQEADATAPTAKQVAERVNALWAERGVDEKRLSREDVYGAIFEARRRDLFRIAPPSDESLQTRLCDRFGIEPDRLRVAASESRQVEHVCTVAAKLTAELIARVAAQRNGERVHLGFGAGWTTRVVAYQLALRLQTEPNVPPLALHAVSSGFAAELTRTAPVTFFGFFEGISRDIREVGMFGPPYVRRSEYTATKNRVGVKDAFDEKDQIDIILTSLAAQSDPHSGLRTAAKRARALAELERREWVGDLQNLPYSATGPITGVGHRAVTLFELQELVGLAKGGKKHIVLVSPPCPTCGRTRAEALGPLLTQQKLKAWTHLVTDMPTARELLPAS